MKLQLCYSLSEDTFPLPAPIKEFYGPFGFPDPARRDRPYISSNFVMGLDGRASFREFPGRTGGKEVSRSEADRWLMDFLRAHHDAQLIGANTLREERGSEGKGSEYILEDKELKDYRERTLGLGRQKIIVVTGSGNLDLNFRLFNSTNVEPWILTTADGAKNLRPQSQDFARKNELKIVSAGDGKFVDLEFAMKLLYQEHGISRLLCEGGPALYGDLLERKLVDEDFRTLSLQVIGASTNPAIPRPVSYGNVSYTPETAPWYTLISLHYALPHHAFFRMRYLGPREFDD